MTSDTASSNPIAQLPQTENIRDRLAHVVREAEVLRRLLKVAEYAERRLPLDERHECRGKCSMPEIDHAASDAEQDVEGREKHTYGS